ncbi:hypothetical protein AB0H32_40495, partial [Streptomyces sp. NPDC020362]
HHRAGGTLAPDPPDLVRLPTPVHRPGRQPVPPVADRIEDVRDRLRAPAAARHILDLDGLNPRVQDVVLDTPGARELIASLADYANPPAGPAASPSAVQKAGTESLTALPEDMPGRSTSPTWPSRWTLRIRTTRVRDGVERVDP